jgi:adenosine/AMP kinase
MNLEIHAVRMEIPPECNIILGQTHFIKTAEDLYEVVATAVPGARFGVAFTESSGPCLIRVEGNDDELSQVAVRNLQAIGAGHVFCIMLRNAFPLNILNAVKGCPEVCRILCATANPLEVIVASTDQGWGARVIDGFPRGIEGEEERMPAPVPALHRQALKGPATSAHRCKARPRGRPFSFLSLPPERCAPETAETFTPVSSWHRAPTPQRDKEQPG